MTTFNSDRIFYVVFSDCGRFGIAETVISDRRELIENVRRGELGYENLIEVHAYNPVEGFAHVVTQDVMDDVEAEIRRLQDADDFPVTARARREREGV